MTSLYADTSSNLTIGLLDENWQWLSYKYIETTKTSNVIHLEVEQMLQDCGIPKSEITRFIYTAGPGSYTGMRVAEGIANIFSWQDIKVNSFYHYEVPAICGTKKYSWMANAYKKEHFVYEYVSENSSKFLISNDKVDSYKSEQEKVYYIEDSIQLIKENNSTIFAKIVKDDIHRELLYYRNIEEEFTQAKK